MKSINAVAPVRIIRRWKSSTPSIFPAGNPELREPSNPVWGHDVLPHQDVNQLLATTGDGGPRFNPFGIQMISEHLYKQLFGSSKSKVDSSTVERCLQELKTYNLLGKQDGQDEIALDLPKLEGNSVEEHFYNIGLKQTRQYRELLNDLLGSIPEPPAVWELQSGWLRYTDKGVEKVDYPLEKAYVFDVEVCVSAGSLPTLAVAVSNQAWYGWVSESLVTAAPLQNSKNDITPQYLIPLESSRKARPKTLAEPKIVVGHNVSYDRARVKEQYWLDRTGLKFLDTMSLHICVSGVTSYQKALLKAGVGEEEWSKVSSLSGLSKVFELYCNKKISKKEVEIFVTGSLADIQDNFQTLMQYCCADVSATHQVFQKVYPLFLERFPHPVTLAGMLELQNAYIPVNSNWKTYIEDSQQAYDDLDAEAKSLLSKSANAACEVFHDEKFKEDLWLWDQDWGTRDLKLKKTAPAVPRVIADEKDSEDSDLVEAVHSNLRKKFSHAIAKSSYLPARLPHMAGYPNWYSKLCNKASSSEWIPEADLVSTAMKVTPKLLQLTWKNMPLHHEKGAGWGYIVPYKTDIEISNLELLPMEKLMDYCLANSYSLCSCCEIDSKNKATVELYEARYYCSKKKGSKYKTIICKEDFGKHAGLVKLPHKDGPQLNVGNPLARDFINKFSENELSGSSKLAKRVIEISRMLSYWRNNRERIENQLVCWLRKSDLPSTGYAIEDMGVILPQVVVCGTLTRRAVEPTWMTVSNAIAERVGSELRGIVHAPPGYALVGADVDSQELWIASLLADAYSAGLHGATPFGWMTLNGQKSDGTDMHSVTAKAVGISRDHAKVLNYARIYGAGQKFAERLLRQFNQNISPPEAANKAEKMMLLTKGKCAFKLKDGALPNISEREFSKEDALELCSMYRKPLGEIFDKCHWFGGTESAMFNCLEEIASQAHPKTPFLNSRLSRALEPALDQNDKHNSTRINWVVQSGAVDFLHLMLVSMRWFLGEKPRFCLSFHDEVRYLVPERLKYDAALALHLTNLLTRAFCVVKVGMTDLPQSVAFFSSVEVDVALRKESHDDSKTPSNPFGLTKGYGVPKGETLTIFKAVEKTGGRIRKDA
ncbi:unnamed protein product [Nesidiocoris tenuis]|uniref:DNA polymerase subunit gamma-1 n=1 Tax=Nesidiocoris tenuis TaxID=355587 RepID=A0A6H5GDJ1_9HEMI|nr:unnamed protein product [Nesidiocoris tenuis]